jgi:dUTP pyrophosphatase
LTITTEMPLEVELKILDPRLSGWGFPRWGSDLAAGLDLHACLDATLILRPQDQAVLVSAGIAIRIADPDWCAMIYPRSGLGHKKGLVLGNSVGVIDADYEGTCFISVWNRNLPRLRGADDEIVIQPGERIAQLVFTRIVRPRFKLVTEFSQRSKRDSGGFGSTGR